MVFRFLLFCAAVASAAALLIIALRLLGLEAAGPAGRRLSLMKPMALTGEPFVRRDALWAAGWGLAALAVFHGAALLYCGIFGDGVSYEDFCAAWRKYDAYHYLGIAEHGYAGYTEGGRPLFLVFFPLYPWLVRALHLIFPDWHLCGLLLSGACFVASCVAMHALVIREFGRRTARGSVVFLTAYPFAFFFASLHTEALFLLLSLSCFYCIRTHRWAAAGVLGALAALTRMQGVFLAVVAFAEYWTAERPLDKLRARDWRGLWGDLWGRLFWMAFMGLGTLIYLGLNWQVAGDPFAFTAFQRERWYQGFALFTTSLTKLWNGFLHPSEGYEFAAYTTWGPQLVLFVFCLIFLLYGARRMPPVWMFYYAVCVFLNFSLNNPLSCCRYIACAFPLPVMLAVGSRRCPTGGTLLLVLYGVLQGIFLMAYFAGRHVC